MIKIEIESTQTESRSGTTDKGKKWALIEQKALMFKAGERFPDKIKVVVPEGRDHYPVGVYTFSDESFSVSRFGAVECRPVLVKVAETVKAAS